MTAHFGAQAATVELTGHVRDENEAPVAGARIIVRPAPPATSGPWQTLTDIVGAFSLRLPAPGDYLIDVAREGYYELKDRPVRVETAQDITLIINSVREVFQSVTVNGQPSPVDITQTHREEVLTGTEVNDIPYPNSHSLRNSMKLMPGVLDDPTGQLHFNGSSENQVQYVLNGFDITDPTTGAFNSTLAVEGIRSLNYLSGRYSPEYGKGSAGVLAINTETGTDRFHYTATDFIPGLNIQQGVRLGNWYPRFGVSGPIRRGRAWYADTFQSEYNNALITGLPGGQNTRSGWAGSNLLHAQVNLNDTNILFTDFLFNIDNQNRVGLGPLDPVSTTQTVDRRQYFGSIRDQFSLAGRALIEIGYGHNQIADSQTPQGQTPYVFSPAGRSGNYFVTSTQGATRDQGVIHVYLPRFHLAGSHQVEAGNDTDLLSYNGDFRRTSYELLGLSSQLLSQTSFFGPGVFTVHDTEVALWLRDTWRITKRLQLDAGLREDWDRLVNRFGWSPRVALSWAPFAAGHTRVAGGYSITHDAAPLAPFGRMLDQSALTTSFGPDGNPTGPPAVTTFGRGPAGLQLPRATNWTAGVDDEISAHLTAGAHFLRRRGTNGFSFFNTLAPDAPPSLLPLPNSVTAGAYQLQNLRRDNYDSVQVNVHQTLSAQYEWMASYTWSRAHSNAVLDDNTGVPLQILPVLVPMPWDAPHRFLGWAYVPLPFKDWAVAALADARTGFPFSVQQVNGVIAGPVGSYRYPLHFDLNLAIERMITFHGFRFALRGGVNNLTNQKNPTAVNNVIGSPQYLQFLGNEGRHFVVRIRFLARATSP